MMLTTIPLFAVVAVLGLVIGAVTVGYFLLAQRMTRLEQQVKGMADQAKSDHVQTMFDRSAVETRLDDLQDKVGRLTTLAEQNIRQLQEVVRDHSQRFLEYDEAIKSFFKDYEIKKKQ